MTIRPIRVRPAEVEDERDSILERLFLVAAAASSLWTLLTTINLARVGWLPIPQADDWDRWTTWFRDHFSWWWLWQQHVDHRLVAPRLLFALDYLLFDGRGWFLLICNFCIQGLTAFLLLRLSERAYPQDRTERWLLGSAVVAFLFCGQQWFNLIMPFQVQFPMVYCAAFAAFFALWKASRENWSAKWAALTIAAATISVYSMASGLLLLPVLLAAAFWLRMPRRQLMVLAAVVIFLIPTYVYHFHKAIVPEHLPASEKPRRVLVFLLAQLGSPMAPLGKLWASDNARLAAAIIPGVLVILALLVACLMLWRRRGTTAQAMLLFYAFFLASTSALIAYGRSQDSPFDAFMSKYLTPPHLLWATLLLAAWPVLRKALDNGRVPRAALFAAVSAVIFFVIAIHQSSALAAVRQQANGVHLGEVAIVNNVADPEAWFWIFHPPEFSMETIDHLRDNHLTLFTEEWSHWTGIPLARRFSIDRSPDACLGKFEDAVPVSSPVKPGWRVTGWAWDNKAGRSPRYIILGDEAGSVAGVALSGFPLPPALAALPAQSVAATWTGYVGGEARPVTAYVLEADGRSLCSIGTARLRFSSANVGFPAFGPLLSTVTPEINGGFTPDGYYKGPGSPGAPPVEGPVYGSFPDANTGSMRIGPFHLDGHTEIGIPLVTGPDKSPLSIVIRDAATKEVLAELSPPPAQVYWWAWHPGLPLDRELTIEILVEDKGTAWGQWIAIGWPHALKPNGQ